jgi:hypothetical protein
MNYQHHNPWQYTGDLEGEEMLTHGLHLLFGMMPDSGGFGKWRGSSSCSEIVMVHKSDLSSPILTGQCGKIAGNQGLFGGYPTIVAYNDVIRDTNFYELVKEGKPLPQEIDDIFDITKKVKGNYQTFPTPCMAAPARPMKSGDIIVKTMPSGAGLGDPIERDPELIRQDILDQQTSFDAASRVYCVSIDPKTFEVDQKKTEEMRRQKIKERLSKGIPAGQYVRLMVEKRKKRELPEPALELLDETSAFSEPFRQQLAAEEQLATKKLKPIGKVVVKKLILKLTPYVNVVEDATGNKVNVCSKCGFGYCGAHEDYKLYGLVYDRDPADNLPTRLAPDKNWAIYREFYCPGCGTQVEVDQCPPGMPIIPNARVKV